MVLLKSTIDPNGMPYKIMADIVAKGNRFNSFCELTVVSSQQESHTFTIESVSSPTFHFVCVNITVMQHHHLTDTIHHYFYYQQQPLLVLCHWVYTLPQMKRNLTKIADGLITGKILKILKSWDLRWRFPDFRRDFMQISRFPVRFHVRF